MGGVLPKTCWASYKYEIKFWYNVASCWIFYVNYTMIHGSMNIMHDMMLWLLAIVWGMTVCVHVLFCYYSSILDLSILWSCCTGTTELSTVSCNIACDLYNQSFNFQLRLQNRVQVGAMRTIFVVVTPAIISAIHIQVTWWPVQSTPTGC
jgi:hypothetical protein